MNEKNWMLFTKLEKDKSHFSELIWYENTLCYREGLFNTWGEEEKYTFDSNLKLNKKVEELKEKILKNDFLLVRELPFKPNDFAFDLLASELELDLSKSFEKTLTENPNINGVCLATDDGAMTLFPIYSAFDSFEEVDDEELWEPNEWEYWDYDFGYFEIVYRILLSRVRGNSFTDEVEYENFFEKFSEICVTSLVNLKEKKHLENKVLIFTSTEDTMSINNCKLLNSEELTERFRKYLME